MPLLPLLPDADAAPPAPVSSAGSAGAAFPCWRSKYKPNLENTPSKNCENISLVQPPSSIAPSPLKFTFSGRSRLLLGMGAITLITSATRPPAPKRSMVLFSLLAASLPQYLPRTASTCSCSAMSFMSTVTSRELQPRTPSSWARRLRSCWDNLATCRSQAPSPSPALTAAPKSAATPLPRSVMGGPSLAIGIVCTPTETTATALFACPLSRPGSPPADASLLLPFGTGAPLLSFSFRLFIGVPTPTLSFASAPAPSPLLTPTPAPAPAPALVEVSVLSARSAEVPSLQDGDGADGDGAESDGESCCCCLLFTELPALWLLLLLPASTAPRVRATSLSFMEVAARSRLARSSLSCFSIASTWTSRAANLSL